jgi:hypothetical protein
MTIISRRKLSPRDPDVLNMNMPTSLCIYDCTSQHARLVASRSTGKERELLRGQTHGEYDGTLHIARLFRRPSFQFPMPA